MVAADFPRFLELPVVLQTIVWTNAIDNYVPTMKYTPHTDYHGPEDEMPSVGFGSLSNPAVVHVETVVGLCEFEVGTYICLQY